ncbi:MAG TPA: class I SAM-dependent methyltransferase [Ktedonobacteraceae bacterium]|nr:class I SAM-dependent methyltransferase [Ktedonobacteraceae bacterium]
MSTVFDHTAHNRRAWNEIAAVRHESQPPASFFAQGNSTLDPRERQAFGDVAGKTLLHLQCATGEDTLSWAIAGAEATGVDISEPQIELARQKAAQANLSARFVAADVYALPDSLLPATFDYVYTGKGVLVWLPDIVLWAQTIARMLKPGGLFQLFEEHPIANCVWPEGGGLQLESDYFGRSNPEYSQGWRHFQGGEQAVEQKAEFAWPLGDIVTAIARAGLRIERLEEFPVEQNWRFNEQAGQFARLPGSILLLARKDHA